MRPGSSPHPRYGVSEAVSDRPGRGKRSAMKIKLGLLLSVLAIHALALAPASSAAAARGKPDYKAYGSCADGKPFKASHHCRYDGGRHFRATFVFESNVGKRPLKACFR